MMTRFSLNLLAFIKKKKDALIFCSSNVCTYGNQGWKHEDIQCGYRACFPTQNDSTFVGLLVKGALCNETVCASQEEYATVDSSDVFKGLTDALLYWSWECPEDVMSTLEPSC